MDSDSRSGTPQPATRKTRTLTASQRERKRAADRKAHRQSRERTKNYIAHLEQLLDEAATAGTVANTDAHGTSTDTSTLLRRLKEDFDKIDRLKRSLEAVCEVAQAALEDASARTSTSTNNNTSSIRAATSALDPNDKTKDGTAGQTHGEDNGEPPIELGSDVLSDNLSSPPPFPQASGCVNLTSTDLTVLDMPFDTPRSDDASGGWERNVDMALVDYHYSPRSIWTLLGQFTDSALRSQAAVTSLTTITPDLARDTDILIRAVLHGWDVAAGDYWLDMTWQTLRQTDQQLLSDYHERPAERLAILYVMRLQLHTLTPRNRPSQKFINHPPHAAYYVWPGFREHLLVWPDRYSSNNLLDHLRSNFRFLWPYEPQGLYVWDRFSGTYSFSSDFSQRIEDIRCWTVQPDFFTLYPELQSEIPVFNGRASFILPSCGANFALSLLTPATETIPELRSSEDAATSQGHSNAMSWQLFPDAASMFRM
ncbi:hypothetical protein ACJ73_03791 [Blastomyces percursus]|uniref:BZIP domain-containing protein n=1 Tax=Blastomyces percursus TaxID=1658174 RepID=A0A1J9QX81_9EURO|nr:hypothetical protein ACJ73_03791 [Blastomyces percursus]